MWNPCFFVVTTPPRRENPEGSQMDAFTYVCSDWSRSPLFVAALLLSAIPQLLSPPSILRSPASFLACESIVALHSNIWGILVVVIYVLSESTRGMRLSFDSSRNEEKGRLRDGTILRSSVERFGSLTICIAWLNARRTRGRSRGMSMAIMVLRDVSRRNVTRKRESSPKVASPFLGDLQFSESSAGHKSPWRSICWWEKTRHS